MTSEHHTSTSGATVIRRDPGEAELVDRQQSPASPLRLGLRSAAINDFAKPQQPNNAVAEDNRYLLRPGVSIGRDKIAKIVIIV